MRLLVLPLILLTASPTLAEGPDAKVAGTDFNATASVPCATVAGQPMGSCDAGVIRNPDGTATVVITWPDGRSRSLFFKDAQVIGADTNQADGSAQYEVKSELDVDLYKVSIGPERYEIPDVLVQGD